MSIQYKLLIRGKFKVTAYDYLAPRPEKLTLYNINTTSSTSKGLWIPPMTKLGLGHTRPSIKLVTEAL